MMTRLAAAGARPDSPADIDVDHEDDGDLAASIASMAGEEVSLPDPLEAMPRPALEPDPEQAPAPTPLETQLDTQLETPLETPAAAGPRRGIAFDAVVDDDDSGEGESAVSGAFEAGWTDHRTAPAPLPIPVADAPLEGHASAGRRLDETAAAASSSGDADGGGGMAFGSGAEPAAYLDPIAAALLGGRVSMPYQQVSADPTHRSRCIPFGSAAFPLPSPPRRTDGSSFGPGSLSSAVCRLCFQAHQGAGRPSPAAAAIAAPESSGLGGLQRGFFDAPRPAEGAAGGGHSSSYGGAANPLAAGPAHLPPELGSSPRVSELKAWLHEHAYHAAQVRQWACRPTQNTTALAPLPSHHCPRTPRKTPLPSHKTPLPSHKTPLPSHTTPLPSHKTPLPSHKTPLPSHKTPLPSHKTPLPSHKTLLPSHKTPLPSDHCPRT